MRRASYREKRLWFVAILLVCFLVAYISDPPKTDRRNPQRLNTGLLGLWDTQVEFDLAEINLRCAEGLPGTEGINRAECLQVLDTFVLQVRKMIARNKHSFRERPEYYENSEAKYNAVQLVLTLQQDFGIEYDPDRINAPREEDLNDPGFFRDAKGIFLTGVLSPARRGTCASLPILVVVVGRRLGYPLKVVTTKGHIFVRWEDVEERNRFNVEAAGRGVDFYSDDYYRTWPFPVSDEEIAAEGFLKSLTPEEELSLCLELRGYCLIANGEYEEALSTLEGALAHRPRSANLSRIVDQVRVSILQQREKYNAKIL